MFVHYYLCPFTPFPVILFAHQNLCPSLSLSVNFLVHYYIFLDALSLLMIHRQKLYTDFAMLVLGHQCCYFKQLSVHIRNIVLGVSVAGA